MTFNAKTISADSSATFEKAARGNGMNYQDKTLLIEDFVALLPDDVQKYIQQVITVSGPLTSSEVTGKMTTERVDNFEISTRSHVLQLVQCILEANAIMDIAVLEESVEEVLVFIRGIIDFCLSVAHSAEQLKKKKEITNESGGEREEGEYNDTLCSLDSAQFRKLPYLLLEDTVDTLPTSIIQVIWKYGPATWLQNLLCSTSSVTLFHQGSKYCLIRMCNRLLKNLSVDAHDDQVGGAQFAGEISMILASIFPLSERSAVNVLGAFHVDNIVEFETLDEWLSCHKNDGISNFSANRNISGIGTNRVALNYDFYSKFWGLQKVFTDPKDLLPKANAAATSAAAPSHPPWHEHMERFFSHLEHVLEVLEGNAFSADLIKHLSARWNAIKRSKVTKSLRMEAMSKTVSDFVISTGPPNDREDAGGDDADVEMEDIDEVKVEGAGTVINNTSAKRQYKYLTNSQLLHLQLKDPEIRIHFLSQLFILSSFLSTNLTNYVSTRVGSTIPNKMLCEKLQSRIHHLEQRGGELLKKTPPDGEVHLNTLQWILSDRESVWRNWKKNRCTPPIEKFRVNASASGDGKSDSSNGNDLTAKRRRLMGSPLIPGRRMENKPIQVKSTRYTYKIDIQQNLPGISMSMTKHSGIDQFLEEYADALDPEAGIEEEYHPKRNKLSSWSALRFLSRRHIGRFENTKDGCSMIEKKSGDFEGIVRTVWKDEKGIDIPGQMPKAEEISDDEVQYDEEQEEDKDGINEDTKGKGRASTIGVGADSEVKDNSDVQEVFIDVIMNEPTEKKNAKEPNGKGKELDMVNESVGKDEGEIVEEMNVDSKDSKSIEEFTESGAPVEKQTELKTPNTNSSDRKANIQPSRHGRGTHTIFSTPGQDAHTQIPFTAPTSRIIHSKPSQNGQGTHVHFSTPAAKDKPDGDKPSATDSSRNPTDAAHEKPVNNSIPVNKNDIDSRSIPEAAEGQKWNTKGDKKNSNTEKEEEKYEDNNPSKDEKFYNDESHHQLNDRKRKHYDRDRDNGKLTKAKKVQDLDDEKDTKTDPINDDAKNRTDSSRQPEHASRRGNYPRRNTSYSNRANDQRQQESRQNCPPQQPRRGDNDHQKVQGSGPNSSPPQQHPRQARRTPPPGQHENRPAGGIHGIHTRFTSPPPNTGMHMKGPRGEDRGGLRGDDRGGPRSEDRSDPRSEDRSGQRGDNRGGPRGDNRGGPRGDNRGGPRGGRGQFDRRNAGGRGGGHRRRNRH